MFSGTVQEILCSVLLSKNAVMFYIPVTFLQINLVFHSSTFSQKNPLNSLENRTINQYRGDFATEAFLTVDQILLFKQQTEIFY